MKENLNTLAELGKEIDLSMFYIISVSEYEIRLQGYPDKINFVELESKGFKKYTRNYSVYDKMFRNNVIIVSA